MVKPKSLHAPFKSAKPELQRYITALESENANLHRQIAKLEAQDVTKQHRITALEKEMKELTHPMRPAGTMMPKDQGESIPSVERTRRFGRSATQARWRHAAHLDRSAPLS
jgi:predicted  nucleic acid-binding Zn-ribbon protein